MQSAQGLTLSECVLCISNRGVSQGEGSKVQLRGGLWAAFRTKLRFVNLYHNPIMSKLEQ